MPIILAFLVDAAAKSTFLLAAAWGITFLLRKRSAAMRHRVWALAIAGLIAAPLCSWILPG